MVIEELVLTPGGHRPKSLVHLVERGHVLKIVNNRVKKIHPSGTVEDFGVIPRRPGKDPLMPKNVFLPVKRVPAMGSGWITYAYWYNNTGNPITYFSTTWTVPPDPATSSGQLIYIFPGIQNSTMIYQPVLQWGSSPAGGGNYWSIASWYADGAGGQAFHTESVKVNMGDVITGFISYTGKTGNNFNYECAFADSNGFTIQGTSLPVQNIEELNYCCETLECYYITQCSDYPETRDTLMNNIYVSTMNPLAGHVAINPVTCWTAVNSILECGQHAVILSNSPTSGKIDLCYGLPGGWHSWESLGNSLVSGPGVASWQQNRLDIFAILSGSTNLSHKWWDGAWHDWESLGGSPATDPCAVSWQNDRIDIFTLGHGGDLSHLWWNGIWQPWESLGAPPPGALISHPGVASWAPNRLDVFAIASDNNLWHLWYDNGWAKWESLGSPKVGLAIGSSPNAVSWQPNRIDIVALGNDMTVQHLWYDNGWKNWESLGAPPASLQLNSPAISSWGPDRLDIFARGLDDCLQHLWYDNGWKNWESLGGQITSDPSAVSWEENRIDIFGRGQNLALWHLWFWTG